MKILYKYINGNYTVTLMGDGTKIRYTKDDEFIPAFAENCDVKITDKCDGGCPMCYEGCTPNGKHADLLNAKWVDSLKAGTELALNGNDMSHPQLVDFLYKLRDKKVFANLTVNQKHFEKHFEYIKSLVDEKLIWGLGVSLNSATDTFVEKIKCFPNAVIHVINGVITSSQVEALKNNDLKMLVLGYKRLERGVDYYDNYADIIQDNQKWLYDNLKDMTTQFKCLSFDNLAIKQLDVKRLMSDTEWEEFYMGDDGNFTFYIDAVEQTFGRNSLTPKAERYAIGDETITEMFDVIRSK